MNDYLIPIIVTLVTAMIIGAIYLLTLLLSEGKSEQESLVDYVGDDAVHADAEAEAAAKAEAPADAKH